MSNRTCDYCGASVPTDSIICDAGHRQSSRPPHRAPDVSAKGDKCMMTVDGNGIIRLEAEMRKAHGSKEPFTEKLSLNPLSIGSVRKHEKYDLIIIRRLNTDANITMRGIGYERFLQLWGIAKRRWRSA